MHSSTSVQTGFSAMVSTEIRALIREVLEEEIGKLKPVQQPVAARPAEAVAINNDGDLNAFARKIASLCGDAISRQQILGGQRQFSLSSQKNGSAVISHSTASNTNSVATFEKGLLNEKTIDALPEGTKTVHAGPRACFTPLARDRMRQLGITLKKVKP